MLVALFLGVALAAPALSPHDPVRIDPEHRLEGPSAEFPLGTDHLGRCLLSRLLHGSRWSIGTAAAALAMILLVGVTVGAVAGYYGGRLSWLLMRGVDALLAFPALIPALAIVGMLGPGMAHVMVALVAVWWAGYARIVHGLVLSVRERPFVEAARALGFGDGHVLRRHVLPNVLPPVLVLASLDMGDLILSLSALTFLGLGAQPPTPEWGAMLNEGRPYFFDAPELMIYPGLAISLVAVAFNLVGEGLRDLVDPRLAKGGGLDSARM